MLGNGIFERKKNGTVSPFSALATAVGGQIGTGNIVGAAAAILIGGPGSVFWMWFSAFFGMATVYAETVAAQKTRLRLDDNEYVGGPVYYIKKAFRGKTGRLLAFVFSFSAMLALGFSGAMVQSNAVCGALFEAFSIPPVLSGVILAVFSYFSFSGGLMRVAKISEKLVVIMTAVFFFICCYVIAVNIAIVPSVLNLIIKSAFMPSAFIGGGFGAALKITISQGVKKGIFSNEAGMGTTPHVHASADAESPHSQGVFAMMGVFIDTFVVLTVTSLVMLIAFFESDGVLKTTAFLDMNNMMPLSLQSELPRNASNLILGVSMALFGFSSIISWNYFGKVNAEYIFGVGSVRIYYIFSAMFVFMGSVFKGGFVWQLTDAMNLFLVIPNVMALFKLNNYIIHS